MAGEEGFAFWRWYGLVADDERWDDAVARAPVTARAAARWLASEGVCEAFPGESVCGETDTLHKMEMRVEHDLEYIRRWGLVFDLKIIFMTVFGSKVRQNAY